ncbi:LSU ribosomal protein L25P [Paludibacter propionicigenes WB4]|uniref:Large ribosomal subunit protein bL25 n=1 Tax=Paludibacter propionicigenes (strain DSM 17365 / JCM 13257 / WB4) TaxID=694427 RepID=E4T3S5_PALPW|nr:50S ribosomal protein L25/general stress protein Ctc [Paludibacter propionicigenes]ADQ79369.1 LSU ribosomal protein L25P [Paludibacter propionicigenes WB4]
MKTFDLKGTVRTDLGKKATKAERTVDNVPCVLYGVAENVHFTTTVSEIRKLVYSPEVFVVNLEIGGKVTKAIMKALQFHPVTDKVLHMDFLAITEDKPVVVNLPVKLEGLAEGVKAGGKLALEMRNLKVKGLYTQIPENIVIDVTELGLGKSIQVAKVSVPNLEILNAKNAVVAQVKLTRAARGAAAAAGK